MGQSIFKKGFMLIVLVSIFSVCIFAGNAETNKNEIYAEGLNRLGIFKGTENGYELDRVPTRDEALVVLLRLLGEEKAAEEECCEHPFTDGGWAEKYIGYGYEKKLINGISGSLYGSKQNATAGQYAALVLRALGYSDKEGGDFKYGDAIEFASIVLGQDVKFFNQRFDRGMMAQMSYLAIISRVKGSQNSLGERLLKKGILSGSDFEDVRTMCEKSQRGIKSTTVLVYMVGSDLESKQGRATDDVKEMLKAKTANGCTVLLQTGGTENYKNSWFQNGRAERFLISDIPKKLQDVSTDATDKQTLSDFIKWGTEYAPAQRYVLVMWDHGFGINGGFGSDELNRGKTMSVSDLCGAIGESNTHFDIIAFDACLMGGIETAYGLKNYADYLIASQETTPSCGFYYTPWLEALTSSPDIDTKKLGRIIMDSFTSRGRIEANMATTMSMIRLDKVDVFVKELTDYFLSIRKGGKSISSYAAPLGQMGADSGIYDEYDLKQVIEKCKGVNKSRVLAYINALSEVRIAGGMNEYGGISVYVPFKTKKITQELLNIGLPQIYIESIIY